MQPDEIVILIVLALLVAYGLSRLSANWPRLMAHIDAMSGPPPPPPQQRTKRPRMPLRTAQDRAKELQWIEAGLSIGLDLQFMARALRGSPTYNRRRVRRVRARLQQREAVTV
jgi:hypothetical protein